VVLTLPFVMFPILSLVLLMGPFVNTWVGSHYENSVFIAQLLILCFIYGSISYPGGFLVLAQEKMKILYITAAIALVIYWTGIALTTHLLGLTSFALFKLIAMSSSGLMYFFITIKFLGFTSGDFAKKILGPVAMPTAFLIVTLSYLKQFMPAEKNALNLFIVVTTGGLVSAAALTLYYLLSNHFRNYAQSFLRECLPRTMIKITDV
jgi:hypothetical protein